MVLSGKKKEELSSMLLDLQEQGEQPKPDLPAPKSWPPREQAQIDHLYASRKEATGLDLNDPKIIVAAKKANFRFYKAPHGIYLFQDKQLSSWSLFDLGLFAQSLMLAAHAKGLGTVPQAFLTDYAPQIKNFLHIPEGKRLVLGISIGYPDLQSPANQLRTERMATEDIVSWQE
jgi:nitroreductase